MSHCINATIVKISDLKEGSKYKKLPLEYCFVEKESSIKEGCHYLKIYTDYFGGIGEQSSELYLNGEKLFEYHTINEGLRKIGVIKGYSDEFDAINLGNYRSNDTIEFE
jgi:hypothetical protein